MITEKTKEAVSIKNHAVAFTPPAAPTASQIIYGGFTPVETITGAAFNGQTKDFVVSGTAVLNNTSAAPGSFFTGDLVVLTKIDPANVLGTGATYGLAQFDPLNVASGAAQYSLGVVAGIKYFDANNIFNQTKFIMQGTSIGKGLNLCTNQFGPPFSLGSSLTPVYNTYPNQGFFFVVSVIVDPQVVYEAFMVSSLASTLSNTASNQAYANGLTYFFSGSNAYMTQTVSGSNAIPGNVYSGLSSMTLDGTQLGTSYNDPKAVVKIVGLSNRAANQYGSNYTYNQANPSTSSTSGNFVLCTLNNSIYGPKGTAGV